jgi:hypothetical protein
MKTGVFPLASCLTHVPIGTVIFEVGTHYLSSNGNTPQTENAVNANPVRSVFTPDSQLLALETHFFIQQKGIAPTKPIRKDHSKTKPSRRHRTK